MANITVYQWDIPKGYIEEGALENADYVIHLAGAGIAELHPKRTQMTALCARTLNASGTQCFVYSAS